MHDVSRGRDIGRNADICSFLAKHSWVILIFKLQDEIVAMRLSEPTQLPHRPNLTFLAVMCLERRWFCLFFFCLLCALVGFSIEYMAHFLPRPRS